MVQDILTSLRKRVARATDKPGIYKWKNKDGDVLYVGKAKNLKNRLKSYVNKGAEKGQGPWKLSLLSQLADFDVTIVNNELEALVLETNLIKTLRPKYNVLMKDGKNYVYVQITVKDPFPQVEILRQMSDKQAKYFGPFISNFDTKRSLDMLNELFGWRACKQSIEALNKAKGDQEVVYNSGKLRPCLDYQIGQCNGLCAGAISWEEYKNRIDKVIEFFKGNYKPVLERGHALMMQASSERKFEKATMLRDMLKMIEGMQERQIVSDTSGENADVIGLALLSGKVQVVVMNKREGKLIGEQQFNLMGSAESISDVLEQFLPQYYENVVDIPDSVILGEDFPSRLAFEEYLTRRRNKKVKVIIPERGNKSRLLELAEQNAQEKAMQAEATWEAEARNTERALEELVRILDLPATPHRIEGYDISHTGGTETVGSMVVCIDGKPRNDHYRSFTIHSMQRGAIDDYRALREVLTRRLRHAAGGIGYEEEKWGENRITFGKAHKSEMEKLRAIFGWKDEKDNNEYKEFLVARSCDEIIGLVRIKDLGGTNVELCDLWIGESAPERLSSFIMRYALKSLKKGKAYVCIDPMQEQNYAQVGFRHVLKTPKALSDRCDATHIAMMYEAHQHKPDVSLGAVPDLLVIDGGKGQLSTIVEVLKEFNLSIPVIGLAKREEEIFVPGKPVSLLVDKDSPAKFLLMRLRDEAHRFANRHRQKRAKTTAFKSALDSVPGIGPETRRELLKEFGSVDAIKRLPDEELGKVLNEEQIRSLRQML